MKSKNGCILIPRADIRDICAERWKNPGIDHPCSGCAFVRIDRRKGYICDVIRKDLFLGDDYPREWSDEMYLWGPVAYRLELD